MRIAIICEVYLPKVDGVVGRTINLIQQLLNNAGHSRRLSLNCFCAVNDVSGTKTPTCNQSSTPADDVQRGAEFVCNSGCEPPDGLEAIAVSQLFHRFDASCGFTLHCLLGCIQFLTHLIQGRRQLSKFI